MPRAGAVACCAGGAAAWLSALPDRDSFAWVVGQVVLSGRRAASPSIAETAEEDEDKIVRIRLLTIIVLLAGLLAGCGYNTFQSGDEAVKSAWSEVLNQYQRRADLVPNLVATVQGYASHEKEVLTQVTQARAQVGSIQPTPELVNDPAAFARFQQAQAGLSSALSRLLVVVERYPQLKADAAFRDLQAQLEGTENRIAVARNRYIKAVEAYNVSVRSFPNNLTAMILGYGVKPNFSVDAERERAITAPPTVDFSAPAAAGKAAPAAAN